MDSAVKAKAVFSILALCMASSALSADRTFSNLACSLKNDHVKFDLRGDLAIDSEGVATYTYGAVYQQDWVGNSPATKGINVSQGKDVALGAYHPRAADKADYLGREGYRLKLDFSLVTGRVGGSDRPDSVFLYLTKNPVPRTDERGTVSEFRALLATKYHDQMSPEYHSVICSTE